MPWAEARFLLRVSGLEGGDFQSLLHECASLPSSLCYDQSPDPRKYIWPKCAVELLHRKLFDQLNIYRNTENTEGGALARSVKSTVKKAKKGLLTVLRLTVQLLTKAETMPGTSGSMNAPFGAGDVILTDYPEFTGKEKNKQTTRDL